jgi:hypothetical protein
MKQYIFIICLIITSLVFYQIKNNELKELNKKYQIAEQNLLAQKDSSNETFYVTDTLYNKITEIKWKTKTVKDTIRDTAFVFLNDSNIIVKFANKYDSGDFFGFTKYDQRTKKGDYFLVINQDSVVYVSNIFIDENGILKNEISGNNVVILNSVIDRKYFSKIMFAQEDDLKWYDGFKLIPSIEVDKDYNVNLKADFGYQINDFGVFLFVGNENIGLKLNYEISTKLLRRK